MVGVGFLLLSGCVRHYRAQGVVLAVDRSNQTVTISHRAIRGYMEAMVMPFQVKEPGELKPLVPGSRVNFELEVRKNSTAVRHIAVQASAALDDVPLPKPVNQIAPGGAVPDFSLTDQRGQSVKLSDFRGKVVAIDFIYTRCPLPDVCPRLSANFARLQKRFEGRIVLLSITLDPQYDTPNVLANYGQRWQANPAIWRFLTGPDQEIQRIAGNFGLVYWPEEGVITHQAATAIISPEGRLAARLEGASFTSQQLLDLVGAELAHTPGNSRD
jgi:protein SCO1/2